MDNTKNKPIADALSHLLADTYTLYLKTQNFHWNVTGPLFPQLHQLFETQYTQLAEAIDTIAERIRALGFRAPASYTEFQKLNSLKEETGTVAAEEMIKKLLKDYETLKQKGSELFDKADEADDQVTADMLVGFMTDYDKNAWMLRSSL